MTIAEVMVAALILVTGSLAVLTLVTASAKNSYRGEQSQVVNDRLQSEMEQITRLPWDQVALTGVPSDSTDTNDPDWRVQGTSYSITQDGTQPRALAYNGGSLYPTGTVSDGVVDPGPTPFTSGDVTGSIYRYVVWEDDPSCPETTCPGTQDLKRVIVAIRLDGGPAGGTVRHYQELQTQISNPATSPDHDPNPGPACTGGADCQPDGSCTGTDCTGGGTQGPCTGGPGCQEDGTCTGVCTYNDKPWLFWLTDTTCNNSSRQPIIADHLAHNTNGMCSTGLQNSSNCGSLGCVPGAPDMLVTNAPPLTGETPLWDYATDIEPSQNADQDKGLQMPPPSSNGCLSSLFQPFTNVLTGALQNDPDVTRMQTIHKWLSPAMGTGNSVALSGSGFLNLWTQSVNQASYAGKICVWLFERHFNVLGVPVDTPALDLDHGNLTYFTYSANPWPTQWHEIHIPLHFSLSVNLGPTSRLGLAIQVEKSGTTGGGLQFLYDEPSYDSRLEVKTSSALPF
jgi:hypothetical protein